MTKAEDNLTKAEINLTQAEDNLTKAEINLTQAEDNLTQAEINLTKAEGNLTKAEINLTQAEINLTQAETYSTQAEKNPTPDRRQFHSDGKELSNQQIIIKRALTGWISFSFFLCVLGDLPCFAVECFYRKGA